MRLQISTNRKAIRHTLSMSWLSPVLSYSKSSRCSQTHDKHVSVFQVYMYGTTKNVTSSSTSASCSLRQPLFKWIPILKSIEHVHHIASSRSSFPPERGSDSRSYIQSSAWGEIASHDSIPPVLRKVSLYRSLNGTNDR